MGALSSEGRSSETSMGSLVNFLRRRRTGLEGETLEVGLSDDRASEGVD